MSRITLLDPSTGEQIILADDRVPDDVIAAPTQDAEGVVSLRIPSGAQTYSKAPSRYPIGAPQAIVAARGAYVYDANGAPWLDCVSGLGSVILGHADPDVTEAVCRQAEAGNGYPLPSLLEEEVAEQVCRLTGTEMVRFAKNGVDACAAAVRIARALTGRDGVVSIGYHGYQDFALAHQNPRGIPDACRDLLTVVSYNNLDALDAAFRQRLPACLLMEPVVAGLMEAPKYQYLEGCRNLCTRTGALLIFDEVVTFGRFPEVTASRHFGITPDLLCLGKCLANGYALSAIAGPADLLKTLEQGVFFSTTFGGETTALAAVNVTLARLPDAVQRIWATGLRVCRDSVFTGAVDVVGYPSRFLVRWQNPEAARIFGEAMIRERVLYQGYVNLTAAWGEPEVAHLIRGFTAGCKAVQETDFDASVPRETGVK